MESAGNAGNRGGTSPGKAVHLRPAAGSRKTAFSQTGDTAHHGAALRAPGEPAFPAPSTSSAMASQRASFPISTGW